MQQPDAVTAFVTPFGEIQVRMGLPPIEGLLAERDELVSKVARLRARHGSFGLFDAERKIELAKAAAIIRAKGTLGEKKLTEAAIEEGAYMHPSYVDFVTAALSEKADWIVLENRIQSIEDTIMRGNVVGRFLASEAMLAR
jgi:5-formaminoimidazole-4-carboxamide-1-beta-D-ribofuranosyl 5'-monophosphate synthetase